MARTCAKLGLLLWKNWKLQARHPCRTVCEILTPVIFILLLVMLRWLIDIKHIPVTSYPAFSPFNLTSLPFLRKGAAATVAWSPGRDAPDGFARDAGSVMSAAFAQAPVEMLEFKSPEEMEAYLRVPGHMITRYVANGSEVWAGVVLEDSRNPNDAQLCSENIKMTLRFPAEMRWNPEVITGNPHPFFNWRTKHLFPFDVEQGPRGRNYPFGPLPSYHVEGFLAIQFLVTRAITAFCFEKKAVSLPPDLQPLIPKGEQPLAPDIQLRRYPYPEYTRDMLLQLLHDNLQMIIMLSFICNCIFTVKAITTEKETQIKETMKIMGLPGALHWLAWFIKTITFLLISVVLIVILLKAKWYPGSDKAVFTLSSGTLIFAFMAMFMVATTCLCFMISVFFSSANTAAAVAALVWYLGYAPYQNIQDLYDTVSLTVKLIVSLSWNCAVSYGFLMILLFEDAGEGMQWEHIWRNATPDDNLTMGLILLMLLLDSAIYLLVMIYVEAVFPGAYGIPKPWYFPVQKSYWCGTSRRAADAGEMPQEQDEANFEAEPANANAGIQIRNLRKVFHRNNVAVDSLSLNMYEGQITVLLGHNGAGKTTTTLMLTGMYTPTSGTALVSGYDIATDMEAVRGSLGLCPQHNVLFDRLTVREHLYFFGKLKGLSGQELEDEIQKYIRLLQLQAKEHAQSRTLSGGMKRKLSAAIALCGKSKVVMFDEPTSGMDPAARRALWDLLREEKAGRTILLTTHFMDEADVLGDRIAIMAGGRLQCAGSPFFLKKRYGAGYRLVVVKGARCSSAAVTQLLKRHLPALTPAQDVGSELSYQLDKEHAPRFEAMLQELEKQRKALDVLSYGISLTTMEEVFMKVGKQQVALEDRPAPAASRGLAGETAMQVRGGEDERPALLGGCALKLHHVRAMAMKKRLVLARGWLLYTVHCLIPLIFLVLAILSFRSAQDWRAVQDLPPRTIELKSYSEVNIPMAVVNDESPGTAALITRHLSTEYKNVIEENDLSPIVLKSSDNITGLFEDYILNQYGEDKLRTHHTFIVGASFDVVNSKPYITGWFNDLPYHSSPLTLNILNNAVLKMIDISLTLVNSPLPFTSESKKEVRDDARNVSYQIALFIAMSMAFVSAYYIIFPVKERISKAKHLQFLTGLEVFVFWIVNLSVDGLSFLVPSLVVIITLAAFQEDGFSTAEDLGRVFVILIFFGWAMLALVYLASHIFTTPAGGYTGIAIFSIFAGSAAFTLVILLQFPALNLKHIADILGWILLVVPHYCLADAIHWMYKNYVSLKLCNEFVTACSSPSVTEHICCVGKCPSSGCEEFSDNYFQWERPGVGRNIIYFIGIGCLFSFLLLLIEFHVFESLTCRRHQPRVVAELEDSDVIMEKERIRTSSVQELTNEFSLVLRDVTKYYGKFLAVDSICVGVKRGECFGLLGVNGAGKTTIFKMMTGDIKASQGDVFVNGLSIKNNMKKVHQLIGYCPQFDALIEEMTGRETLHMFCLLRGIPGSIIPSVVNELADELLLMKHSDKKVKEYSGGNKRKLSTAIALVGNPPVVLLDEPTTGMDAVAKRHLWNVICKVRDRGTSIVLTSHSMEECEALCTRLAIMVNGSLKCLGSTQHLKSKFAEGFTLIIKVTVTQRSSITSRTLSTTSTSSFHQDLNPVKNFIKKSFPGSILMEEYMGLLTYYIPPSNFTWSQMFGMMEKAKRGLNIEDYSLGQTSLEQVFLTFTKGQKLE